MDPDDGRARQGEARGLDLRHRPAEGWLLGVALATGLARARTGERFRAFRPVCGTCGRGSTSQTNTFVNVNTSAYPRESR
jgi:hypothetical protein